MSGKAIWTRIFSNVAERWLRRVRISHAICLVFMIGAVAAPPRVAHAAWGGWEDLGGTILGSAKLRELGCRRRSRSAHKRRVCGRAA